MHPPNFKAADLPIGSVIATGFRVAISLHSPGNNDGYRWSCNWPVPGLSSDAAIQDVLDTEGADVLRVGVTDQ